MQNQRLELTHVSKPDWIGANLKRSVSVIALAFTLNISHTVLAQDLNLIVDLTDPYVSVDLSVLDDGGLAPYASGAAAPASGAMYQARGFQTPGKDMPVSTLYIEPSSGFRLPPQTKAIEAMPVPRQMDEAPAPAQMAEAATSRQTAKAVVEPAPMAPPVAAPIETSGAIPEAPVIAPPPTAVVESVTVESVLEAVAAPIEVAMTPTPPVATPEPVAEVAPTPEPESTPVALDADATPPMASKEVAAVSTPKSEDIAPPPPPQAAAVPTPVEHDETQTAPKAKPNEIVLPLPPRDEVASLPPATGPLSDGDSLRIVFEADSSKLPQSARDALMGMATKMSSQNGLRLQLLAYAGTADTSASAARRLSLSRALAVRSYLIENGVRSTRIDVRALGNKSTEEVSERVDITVVER